MLFASTYRIVIPFWQTEERRITVTDCDTYDYFEELMKVRRVVAIDGSGKENCPRWNLFYGNCGDF